MIMIAHRLSTVCRAHRIFVMEEGRVAEQGSHDELLKARGAVCKNVEGLPDISRVEGRWKGMSKYLQEKKSH